MSDIMKEIIRLINNKKTLNEISQITNLTPKEIANYLLMIKNRGYEFNRIYYSDGNIRYSQNHQYNKPACNEIILTNNTSLHALAISDTHIGSNRERLDLLNEAYEYATKNNINIIFHCGDMLDNNEEEKIPREDRVEYLLKNYPYDKNVITFAVLGNHDLGPLTERGQNIKKLINNYRHDIKVLNYLSGILNVSEDQITLYHPFNENSFISKYHEDASLILQGHSHLYQTRTNKLKTNQIRINVPTLSDILVYEESYPSMLDLEIQLVNNKIEIIEVRQLIYVDNKFRTVNLTIHNLSNQIALENNKAAKKLVLEKQTPSSSQIEKFNNKWNK